MRAGKGSSEAYLADWKRSDPRPVSGELDAIAKAEAAKIEARYSDADLERLIRSHGLEAGNAKAAASAPDAPPPDGSVG